MKRIIGIILSFATIFCLAPVPVLAAAIAPTPEPFIGALRRPLEPTETPDDNTEDPGLRRNARSDNGRCYRCARNTGAYAYPCADSCSVALAQSVSFR